MRHTVSIFFLAALLSFSLATQANEHVRVSGDKYSATIAFGGPKVRFDGSPGTYAFLLSTPPVNGTLLGEWLFSAYVEGEQFAGFANCPVDCLYGNACMCGRVFECTADEDGLPGVESTYWGVRVAIADGVQSRCFWYDKFAAYARNVLADSTRSIGELTAACRLLEMVTGFNDSDRVEAESQIGSRADALGAEAYALVPLVNAASVSPTPALRNSFLVRAEIQSAALVNPRIDALLELAHLKHALDRDLALSTGAIADAVMTLLVGGGFRSSGTATFADLESTLAALEALDLVGELWRIDADAVRGFVLDCWVAPGFSLHSPTDGVGEGECTNMRITYAGTECLAILENRGVPDQ